MYCYIQVRLPGGLWDGLPRVNLPEIGLIFYQMQVFPTGKCVQLGPTGFGDSPYQVFSSSAGNPYFIDWEPLISLGYIRNEDLHSINHFAPTKWIMDLYGKLFFHSCGLHTRNFLKNSLPLEKKYGSLMNLKNYMPRWLEPFAKFQTLKTKNDLKPWWLWDEEDKNAAKYRIPDHGRGV